jgi:hypothetical protein
VDIVLKCTGQVHINDMADTLDIETSAGDVRRHQHAHRAGAKILERRLTLILRPQAMEACRQKLW